VDVRAASGRILRAERKVVRAQRRLWLAQLVFWPAVLTLAVVALLAALMRWQRSRQRHSNGEAVAGTAAPPDGLNTPVQGAAPG